MDALPDVFLAYQQDFMAAVFEHPVVVEEKSRRTGFSWSAGAIATLTGSAVRAAGGMDVLYLGYNLEMAREFIDYVADWARKLTPAAVDVQEFIFADPDRPERSTKAFRVEFASGFKVLALPSVARALRGMQGLVIIDEAAFHDDLDGLLKAAFALLIWGGTVVVISTHNGETNPFNVLVQDIRAGRRPYYLGRTTFDDALADGLYRRICLTTGKAWSPAAEAAWREEIIAFYGDGADEELFAIPSPTTGNFIPLALIEARTVDGVPVLRLECSAEFSMWAEHVRRADVAAWCEEQVAPALAACRADEPHVFGFDCGRRGDLSVIWPMAIGRDLVRRPPFVVELRRVPFAQQQQVLWYVLDRLPRLRAGAMDAGGLGMQLAEETAQHYGERIAQVMLTEPWYREHMAVFKAAFEDATIEVPRDRDIQEDLRGLKIVRGIGRAPLPTERDRDKRRHCDAAIAAALGYAASRADPEVYDYQGGLARREDAPQHAWSDREAREWAEDHMPASRGILPELRGAL